MRLANLYQKTIRYFINRDWLGFRWVNFAGYGVFYDASIGRIYQNVSGSRIYVAHPKHALPNYGTLNTVDWLCREIYFKYYEPKHGDIYVDIGTGYGHEIVWLCSHSSPTVICAEPNQEVFSYLQANVSGISSVQIHGKLVGEEGEFNFPFSSNYASSGLGHQENCVQVHGITFDHLLGSMDDVSLLKMNIEGGERSLLEKIDLQKIRRIVVSCHDFRANRGDGEFFRTYDFVSNLLIRNGFSLKKLSPEIFPTPAWRDSVPFWIYGENSKVSAKSS